LGHYIPSYVAHAARAGYDCIWLDLEHRAMDPREIESLLARCHLHDIDCLLRPPTREKGMLYRYLEDGAAGLLIPHVATAEQAKQLVQAVKFPPLGDRGLDSAGLDSDYAASANHVEYAKAANVQTFLAVQIESPLGVENCHAIASVDGVDAIFIGPGDLGLRLRLAGASDNSPLEAAIARIAEACRAYNKVWGCPVGSLDELQRRRAQGAQLLCNFGEYRHLMNGLESAIKQFDK
jgi:2-keto-3-deoxy-L-rhamnonate aldolase RhmA